MNLYCIKSSKFPKNNSIKIKVKQMEKAKNTRIAKTNKRKLML